MKKISSLDYLMYSIVKDGIISIIIMANPKTSLVCTVLNEEKTIEEFIDSVLRQTILPSELIIVDGGSKDRTVERIKNQESRIKGKKIRIKLIEKTGNRSIGRNEGIKHASSEIILLTDSGCLLDRNWVENISKPFANNITSVVAGYYKGVSKDTFQKCLIPYVLVMEDKIDENNFLPATRSMALKKIIWERVGKFNEKLSHNEDYEFANKLKKINAKIAFAKDAIVNWIPRKNLKESFIMFFRFAFGDGEAGILRDKVLLIFARYIFYAYLIALSVLIKSQVLLGFVIISPIIYILWAIYKNYKYVKDLKAFIILPILQITSDLAVLVGTILGIIKLIIKVNYIILIRRNLTLFGLIGIYILSLLFVITSGIPNQSHPFPYQMDEWHQSQSVRNVFKYGTPNLSGSANGTMFHFFISGILLIPFYLSKVVNPFLIKSAVDSLYEQEKLFIILRLITLFFGILSLVVVAKIAKLLKVNSNLAVLLFFVTPVWLVLSNFFKYDIALVFWIVLSLYFLIKYHFSPTLKNFILGSFFAGIAFSVKVTGLTMLPIVVLAYFLFTPLVKKKYFYLLSGLFVYIFTSVFLGLPDIIFGGRSMYTYLYENIISGPKTSINYILGYSLFDLNFLHKFPDIFGHFLYLVTVIVVFYISISLFRNLIHKKYHDLKLRLFLLISFLIFLLSLFSLGIFISANRAIVLLPFIILLDLIAFKDLLVSLKNIIYIKRFLIIVFVALLLIQISESYLWLGVKNTLLPQQLSSKWAINNIPVGSNLGLENIPIYQFEPDFITKEFYYKQYHPNTKTRYNYFIIDSKLKDLPEYIVVSNINFEQKYLKMSPKNDLFKRLKNEGYIEVVYFPLEIPFDNFFDSNFDYPYMGLTVYPQSISVFKKHK